ncbi:hypothetical protein ACQ4PT_008652 [Festuca glaucescens]
MPSWPDSDSSTQEHLSDLTDMDYAPDTCEDITFAGLAAGCGQRCRVHNLEPNKCVAFEGTNTGRRFYMCSVPNKQVMADNLKKMNEEKESIFDLTRAELEAEVNLLKTKFGFDDAFNYKKEQDLNAALKR